MSGCVLARRRSTATRLLPPLIALLALGAGSGCADHRSTADHVGVALPAVEPSVASASPVEQPVEAISPAATEEPTRPPAHPSAQGTPAGDPPQPTPALLPPPPPADAVPLTAGPVAPVFTRLRTDQPVVFITIDDGWTRDARAARLIKDLNLPVTLFLIDAAVREDPAYFRGLHDAGATIEDHTLTHPDLRRLGQSRQEYELCGAADSFAARFGRRPTLMRPPYGSYDWATQRAAAACGLKAVVMWDVEVKAGRISFADARSHLEPGDVVLLHFRPELYNDLQVLLSQVRSDRLTVARLEDYL